MIAGADGADRHRDAGAVSGESAGKPEVAIYRPEYRSGLYSQGGTTREQRCSDLEGLRYQAEDELRLV
ncbi:hypothetical protein [Duncaniella dubosii]|uniref:hypothetical protein n=1 Tax=Duncaniella dubosii TaxID=2518971 RepID=UPI0023F4ED79|nr:hypothetical protein [Duncaniella dubosii]